MPYRDMAVLYRAHYVTRTVEEVLLRGEDPLHHLQRGPVFRPHGDQGRPLLPADDRLPGRPVLPAGGQHAQAEPWASGGWPFWRSTRQKQGCSLYQALSDNLEDPILQGTKAPPVRLSGGDFSAGYDGRPVSEVLSALLNESGYERMLRTEGSQERLDNLAELKQSVYEYETTCGEESTLEHYLSHVALFTNADAGEQGDKVKLMTVHAAKGLEFPYVFLCGMNEGIFPSRKVRTLPGDGGGAAAGLCGPDPGGEGPLPLRGGRPEL